MSTKSLLKGSPLRPHKVSSVAAPEGPTKGASIFGSCKPESDMEVDKGSSDDLLSMDKINDQGETLSIEILVAVTIAKKDVFKTCCRLVDTRTSSSLMSCKLESEEKHKTSSPKTARWTTKAEIFEIQERILVWNIKLPQFTTKRTF